LGFPATEDVMGLYAVGGANFDLSDLEHFNAWTDEDNMEVELDENVSLRIVEQTGEES
jgi:hypothetical protein